MGQPLISKACSLFEFTPKFTPGIRVFRKADPHKISSAGDSIGLSSSAPWVAWPGLGGVMGDGTEGLLSLSKSQFCACVSQISLKSCQYCCETAMGNSM